MPVSLPFGLIILMIFALISLPLYLNSEIDEENEFKIELLFFKYREVATSEIFNDFY